MVIQRQYEPWDAYGAAPGDEPPKRSPLLGIVSIPLSVIGGVPLLWVSGEGGAGDLIGLVGRSYNTVRAVLFCVLVLGVVLGVAAMRTRRGRWRGFVGVLLGGGMLLLIIVVVVLVMLLFAVIGGVFLP